MPHISDTQGILLDNLRDAGCDEALTRRFLALVTEGREKAALALLAQHRRVLLDCCHADQRRLDCLDHLVYRMEKAAREGRSPLSTAHNRDRQE